MLNSVFLAIPKKASGGAVTAVQLFMMSVSTKLTTLVET